MSINLNDQLARLAERVRRSIAATEEGHPLKRWFAIELELLEPGQRGALSMEDLSARMRAIRQLEYMVLDHQSREVEPVDQQESLYTTSSRNPASHLEMVKQTNFSIEPKLLLGGTSAQLFDLVSPTAKVVGYLRSRDAALGFAECLSCPDEARAILQKLGITDAAVQSKLSLLFRSRYHCFNEVVAQRGVHQVLEIASGISPRGLHWSREHPGTVYIESDLPALMRGKAKVLRNSILDDPVERRGVLHCCGLDALDLASLQHALEYTDPDAGLVIVTEGLLLYFNADEMQRFLKNMHTVLAQRPRAVWVVDMIARQHLQDLCSSDPAVASAVKSVFASTQRAVIADNPFQQESSIHDMLRASGLRVASQALLSDCAQSGKCFPQVSAADARSICGQRKIWTIAAD